MTLFERASRHSKRMGVATLLTIIFVVGVDRIYGHSTLAFAAAIVVLIWLNMPMMRFNCPRCGHNAFIRKFVLLPWPNRSCAKCQLELDKPGDS